MIMLIFPYWLASIPCHTLHLHRQTVMTPHAGITRACFPSLCLGEFIIQKKYNYLNSFLRLLILK